MRPVALILLLAATALADERALIEAMRSPDFAARNRAFDEARALEVPDRLAALRAILREIEDPHFRSSACVELANLGPAAIPAIDDLIRAAYDADRSTRGQAIQAIGALGPSAWRTRWLLIEMGEEESWFDTSHFVRMIGVPDRSESDPLANEPWRLEGRRIATGGATLPELEAALTHEHPYVLHQACRALARLGAEGLAVLGVATRSESGPMRLRAVLTLATSRDRGAIPHLLRVLAGGDEVLVGHAIEGLGYLQATEAEEAIRESLRDADYARASTAITALERIRPGASDAVLRAWLGGPDAERRELAVQLISRMQAIAVRFLPELIQSLYTPRRSDAIGVIRLLGTKAAAVGPFLLDIKEQKTDFHLAYAIRVTSAKEPLADPFDETTTGATLLEALRGKDWLRAGLAARRLGAIGEADRVLPELATALHHPKPFVVSSVFDALEARGLAALPVLTKTLESGSLALRTRALASLIELGPGSAPALDAVLPCLDDLALRHEAMRWIEMVGPAASAAAPKLIEIYRATEHRAGMGKVLAALGEPAAGIIPDLIESAQDESHGMDSIQALARFGPLAEQAAPVLGRIARERYDEVPNARQVHVVIEAIAALPYLGGAGEREIRPLLGTGIEGLERLATDVFLWRKVETESLLRIYWDFRDSESEVVRKRAQAFLRMPRTLERLDRGQLVQLFEANPTRSPEVAKELIRRSDPDELIALLAHEHIAMRRAAFAAVKERELDAALPALARRLVDERDYKFKQSMLAFICERKGKEAQPVVVAFARKHPTRTNLDSAHRRLKAWGDVPYLCELLTHEDAKIRGLAGRTLRELKPAPDPKLREALTRNLLDPKLRTWGVADILVSWGAEGAPALVQLTTSLKSSDYKYATKYLEKMGAVALPALREALAEKHGSVRRRAVYLMEKCGPKADDDLRRLLTADPDEDVREAVVRAFAHRGSKAAPLLLPALEDEHRDVRREAWKFFGNHRDVTPQAVPVLVRTLGDEKLRADSIRWLKEVPELALPALRRAADAGGSTAAVLALADLGEVRESALRPILAGRDLKARQRAVELIAQLGPEAEASARDLILLLGSSDNYLQVEVVRTLGCLGAAAQPALDRIFQVRDKGPDAVAVAITRIEHPPLVLVDLIRSGRGGIRNEVWLSLKRGRAASLEELMALAACEHHDIARPAVEMIGDLGPAAKEAIPLLTRLGKVESLKRYAEAALAKIQPK